MTPMMQQYRKLKEEYADTLLFFRLGDFYELFFEDAIEASQLLDITLTARGKGDGKAPMCGVPHHAATGYIAKLTQLGKKVAICEQLSDPRQPGIVQRDVVRIVTPGTTLDENVLDQKVNNFVMAVVPDSTLEVAFADVTTGEFQCIQLAGVLELVAEVGRLKPAEVIVPQQSLEHEVVAALRNLHPDTFVFGVETDVQAAADLLMEYLRTTQKTSLEHMGKAQLHKGQRYMALDEATLKNLELLSTLRESKKEGSLLWVLDKTQTAMGGRLLRSFVTRPLVVKEDIDQRLDAVDELVGNLSMLEELGTGLKGVLDLERLLARLSMGRGNARDMVALKTSLQQIPQVKACLSSAKAELLQKVYKRIDGLEDLVDLIGRAVAAEPPLAMNEGGIIADGYNKGLDELKGVSREGKQFIQRLQQQEIERTGIGSMKVRFNKVFGYYIEVSKTHTSKVPEHYIRKQTLVNAERYITPELKEFEEKVLGAEEKIIALEQKLFSEVRQEVVRHIERIQQTAKCVALLDVLGSLARVALEHRYCKPVVCQDGDMIIEAGRHPVVEKMSASGDFVPNDTGLMQQGERLQLITGPNMGGKSTYLRQVALITLLAQMGSFVPAKRAAVSLVDRIFTRVGASDNLVRGQSTFMVEMQETAFILKHATAASLVILDEIGRGTSTYDGMSIAWSIMEYLHNEVKAKTLFATHYHELISLADTLKYAGNYAVAVKEEDQEGVVFLYKVLPGGVDKSYGIEVAKLANMPDQVIRRAQHILRDLEEGVLEPGIQRELAASQIDDRQGKLFDREQQSLQDEAMLRDELGRLDPQNMTPLEALQKLDEIKKNLT